MNGYVYILSNPSMPDVVKIGRSKHGGKRRAGELYNTGVPDRFKLEFEIYSDFSDDLEREIHAQLNYCRENKAREFFKILPADAIVELIKIYLVNHDYIALPVDYEPLIDDVDMAAHDIGVHPFILAASFFHIDAEALKEAVSKRIGVLKKLKRMRENAKIKEH